VHKVVLLVRIPLVILKSVNSISLKESTHVFSLYMLYLLDRAKHIVWINEVD